MGRLKSLIKNIALLSFVLGIVTFWSSVPTPSEKKFSEKSRKESVFSNDENTPCVANRRRLVKYFEVNNTNHEFSCFLMNPNIAEKECKVEESNAKKFFNDNQVLRRLRMMTPSKEYFTNIKTVAFKESTPDEIKTPLAFSILCHSNLGILEALLASIFRPHNSYCIYVDNKVPKPFLNNVKRLINAYKMKFPNSNIFLANEPRMDIYWGSSTLLEAPLSCMKQLLKFNDWKYFLNSVGTALPTLPIQNLTSMLSRLGKDDDIIMSEKMPPEKERLQTHKYIMPKQSQENVRDNVNMEGKDGAYLQNDVPQRTEEIKEKPPFDLTIRWGWTESVISRRTAKMIINNKPLQELRKWVQDVFFPEEFFYATLATLDLAAIKKTNTIEQDLNKDTDHGICVRKSLWSDEYKNCWGQFKRDICNLNIEDLPAIFKTGCLYANKFDLSATDGRVVTCMHDYLTQ